MKLHSSLGEVSFHHNLNFHTASRNRTNRSRIAFANTYFRDGARVIKSPTMVSGDWQKFGGQMLNQVK